MLKTNLSLIVVAVVCIFSAQQSPAGPLTSAEVTKIINRVSVIDPAKGGHPATIRDIIKDDLGLQTGAKSRSELLFQDNTLTRLGAETFFSFKTGTRDMTLEKGSMLLQVPKGLGGAKIHTAAVTAAITGTTIMMEYIPKQYIKVLVLEGSLRLSRNGAPGDSVVLRPGKMVIMRPDANRIPDPVDVNLEHIVKTSPLVNFPGGDTLPSMLLIQAAINDQAKELAKGILVPTNLVIGHGTRVILASNGQLATTLGRAGLVGSLAANASTTASVAVNNLLGSRGVVTNGLLGGNLTGTTVSVSNSNQLLALLSNAAPGSGGTIMITPATVNAGANVTVAGAGTVNASTSGGTVNATANVPLSGNSLPAVSAGTVPTLVGQTPIGANTPALVSPGPLPGQIPSIPPVLGSGH
jgi:FecR protein